MAPGKKCLVAQPGRFIGTECLLPDLLRQCNYALWFSSHWSCPGMQKVGGRTVEWLRHWGMLGMGRALVSLQITLSSEEEHRVHNYTKTHKRMYEKGTFTYKKNQLTLCYSKSFDMRLHKQSKLKATSPRLRRCCFLYSEIILPGLKINTFLGVFEIIFFRGVMKEWAILCLWINVARADQEHRQI